MAKNCFIYEKMNDVSSFDVKTDNDGFMHLSGVFGVCGVRNNNKRVYDKANYTEMVNRLQKKIQEEGCPGELEHPNSMNITLENVSHKIDKISIDENGVVSGTITLLNTPKGKIAQELVKGGVQLFISSRATGNVAENGNVTLENLATYDLVGTPGFSQARLHLNEGQIVESLGDDTYCIINKEDENKLNENTEDMENKELLEKIALLEERIKELESRPTVEQIATGVQRWITEEYTPELKDQISESMNSVNNDEFVSNLADGIQEWMINEYSPVIEKWVKEEYDQSVQDWITEQYSPILEKWIKEEYSQGLQQWLLEEYAPAIEGWIKEEYSQGIQAWIMEHYTPTINDWVKNQIKESKKSSLDSIDQTLALLESTAKKPSYGRKSLLIENNNDEPKFIREMPDTARVKWNLCNEATKDAIMRKAKLYSFVNENSIQEFWNNVDFTEVKPSQSIYEGLESVQDEWEKNIRLSFRKKRI